MRIVALALHYLSIMTHRCRGLYSVTIWAIWERTPQGALSDNDPIHIGWARNAYTLLQPYIAGRYANVVMFENANDTRLCYESWDRLQRVKRRYDPQNLFRELDYHKAEMGMSANDASANGAVVPTSEGSF